MCEMASFIVTQGQVLWSTKTNSHSEILLESGIQDVEKSPEFVKIEIVPVYKDYSKPLEEWKFRVDQKYLPDWFNAAVEESACREALVEWAKHYIHRNEAIKLVTETGIYIDCSVEEVKITGGDVRFYDSSTCTANNSTGGDVEFWDSSTCTANNSTGGDVRFYDSSTCTANNSTGGYVRFYDSSTCTANNSTGGNVRFYDSSTCTANNSTGGDVSFWGSSTCKENNRK